MRAREMAGEDVRGAQGEVAPSATLREQSMAIKAALRSLRED